MGGLGEEPQAWEARSTWFGPVASGFCGPQFPLLGQWVAVAAHSWLENGG